MTAVCDADALITVGITETEDVGDGLTLWPARRDLTGGPAAAGLWWNTLDLPGFTFRYDYAPTSRWLPGAVLLGAVPDASALNVTVVAQGTDLATLEAQKAALAAGLAQWTYTVFVSAVLAPADPVSLGSWAAKPTLPVWGTVTPSLYGMLVCQGAVSIPVNPIGAD